MTKTNGSNFITKTFRDLEKRKIIEGDEVTIGELKFTDADGSGSICFLEKDGLYFVVPHRRNKNVDGSFRVDILDNSRGEPRPSNVWVTCKMGGLTYPEHRDEKMLDRAQIHITVDSFAVKPFLTTSGPYFQLLPIGDNSEHLPMGSTRNLTRLGIQDAIELWRSCGAQIDLNEIKRMFMTDSEIEELEGLCRLMDDEYELEFDEIDHGDVEKHKDE